MTHASHEAPPDDHRTAPLPDSPDGNTRTSERTDLIAAPAKQLVEAGAAALSAQVDARIRAQYHLAKLFPRNWFDVRSRLLDAFKRPMLAEGAIYSKPIGGKSVEGLSIRFAEEAFRSMGNIIVETMLVSDDEDKRVYTVSGMDMETNASLPVSVVVTKQIERSTVKSDSIVLGTRTNSKGGKTYILKATSEDDYRAKEQAALQKARRDVIIFLVPGDIKEECEARIKETIAKRDDEDPQGAINRVADLYHALGVSVAEIEKFLGHGIKSINKAELHVLRTIYTGIKEGEGTWASVIESKLNANTGADGEPQPVAASGAAAALKQKLGVVPASIVAIRAKRLEKRTDDEHEELGQYDQDH